MQNTQRQTIGFNFGNTFKPTPEVSLIEDSKNVIEILLRNCTIDPMIREMAKETLQELKNKLTKLN